TTWKIYDLYDLKKFSEIVNDGYSFAGQTILLESDITINKNVLSSDFREPEESAPGVAANGLVNLDSIGLRDKPFGGIFDGQGHTISGYYSYKGHQGLGFFGSVENASIKNLILLDSCVINSNASTGNDSSDDDRFAGLIGCIDNNGGVTVQNCVVECVVGSKTALDRGGPYEYCGGLIGRCDAVSTVTDCTVLARVYAQGMHGVIAGRVINEEDLTQTNVVGYDADVEGELEAGKTAVQEAAASIRAQFGLQE
ncbi:MAG: hypothetical protein J6Z17_05505, partial [Treponema sp.]|nr:hypothetical protein [Treponema sp.]